MGDNYYDRRGEGPDQQPMYFPPPPSGPPPTLQPHYGVSSPSLDHYAPGYQTRTQGNGYTSPPPGYQSRLQAAPYNNSPPPGYNQYSNMHLMPYNPNQLRAPSDSQYTDSDSQGRRHGHHHHRHHHHRAHSWNGRGERAPSPEYDDESEPERGAYQNNKKTKYPGSKKKKLAAGLLGAAGGGILSRELGGGKLATVVGVLAGAIAGEKLEGARERRKSEKLNRESLAPLYDDRRRSVSRSRSKSHGRSERAVYDDDEEDDEDDGYESGRSRRKHRHHHRHRRHSDSD